MPTTTYLGLTYPALSNAPNVPQDMQTLAGNLDSKLGGIIICTSTTRPAARDGATIYQTDTDSFHVSNGSVWRPISGPGVVVEKTTGLPATIGTASWTSVQWSATRVISDTSMWAIGNPTRLVAPIAGWYAVDAVLTWSGSSATTANISVCRNAVNTDRWRGNTIKGTALGGDCHTVHAELTMAASDYVEIQAICGGANGTLNQFDQCPWASLKFLRSL